MPCGPEGSRGSGSTEHFAAPDTLCLEAQLSHPEQGPRGEPLGDQPGAGRAPGPGSDNPGLRAGHVQVWGMRVSVLRSRCSGTHCREPAKPLARLGSGEGPPEETREGSPGEMVGGWGWGTSGRAVPGAMLGTGVSVAVPCMCLRDYGLTHVFTHLRAHTRCALCTAPSRVPQLRILQEQTRPDFGPGHTASPDSLHVTTHFPDGELRFRELRGPHDVTATVDTRFGPSWPESNHPSWSKPPPSHPEMTLSAQPTGALLHWAPHGPHSTGSDSSAEDSQPSLDHVG